MAASTSIAGGKAANPAVQKVTLTHPASLPGLAAAASGLWSSAPAGVKSAGAAGARMQQPGVFPSLGLGVQNAASVPSPGQAAAHAAANSTSTTQQYLNYLKTNMGRLQTVPTINPGKIAGEAQSELSAETSPLLAGLASQQQEGQAAINGYTKEFAGELGQIAPQVAGAYQSADAGITGAYQSAETSQAAVDAATAAYLSGQGGAQANGLAATLASRGQDTSVAAQATQDAQGYAGANYATGSASLSQLLGQGAAATTQLQGDQAAATGYAGTLPGIAALSGLQATKGLAATIAQQRSQIISDAEKQYPGLVNTLTGQAIAGQKNVISQNNQVVTQNNNLVKNVTTSMNDQTKAAQTWTTKNGYLSNPDGSPQLTKGGQLVPAAGFQSDGRGGVVKTSDVNADNRNTTTYNHDQVMEGIAHFNATTSRESADTRKSLADDLTALRNTVAGNQWTEAEQKAAEGWSAKNGFYSNPDGTPILDAKGNKQYMGGYGPGANGTTIKIVQPKTPTVNVAASRSTGVLTFIGADGQPHAFGDANGKPIAYQSGTAPKAPTPNVTASRSTGFVSYVGADGKIHLVAGPDGKPVAYKGAGATSTGGLTGNELLNRLQTWHNGKTSTVTSHVPTVDPTTGKQVVSSSGAPQFHTESRQVTSGQLSWGDAVAALQATGKSRGDAVKAVNGIYTTPGQDGRPYVGAQAVQLANEFVAHGLKLGKTVAEMLQVGGAQGLPRKAILAALHSQSKDPSVNPNAQGPVK